MHPDPVELEIPRPDGTLRVLRWGRGPRQAVALHGITANAVSWLPVADALPTEWSLFAVDLRGRGHSAELPGPYGFDRHITDVLDAVAHLGLELPVLTGHSLGAYLALLIFDRAPDLFDGLLLVDGGCRCRSPTARTWIRCWTPAWAPRWPGCARATRAWTRTSTSGGSTRP